jgi:hypothetical protein
MKLHILTLADEATWQNAFDALPAIERDPGFSPQWYRLFEAYGYGEAYCALGESDGSVILYPFLKNSINDLGYQLDDDYSDIQGAPGYNGIAASKTSSSMMKTFRRHFSDWCNHQHIVAEFSRCNPVTGNHQRFEPEILCEINRNIIVNLQPENGLESQYDRSARKNIRKAEREGLTVEMVSGTEIDESLLTRFHGIYLETMERNSADQEYHYSLDFFRNVADRIGGQIRCYFTFSGGVPVAAEMVVTGSSTGYSWLGGTQSEHYPLRPNDILKDRIIKSLAQDGYSWYCLGGGLIPGDGIFKYKQSFAPLGERPFYIARTIHHQGVYQDIQRQWRTQYPEAAEKYSKRVLGYRELQ